VNRGIRETLVLPVVFAGGTPTYMRVRKKRKEKKATRTQEGSRHTNTTQPYDLKRERDKNARLSQYSLQR
jgi:hypothetical protein